MSIVRQGWGAAAVIATIFSSVLCACGGDPGVAPATAVAVAPAASGVQVDIAVIDSAAQPLAGVDVQVVGATAATTTAADGTGRLDLPAAAAQLLRFSKAGYTDNFKPVRFGAGSTATLVLTSLRQRDAAQSLDASAGGRLDARDGASVELPANALVDALTGAAVSGSVDVAMTPIDVGSDELRAFPGDFSGVDDSGQVQTIATYGTTEFVITQGGKRLNLAPGRTATIELPIYTPYHSVDTPVAVGDSIPLWSLDETSGVWKQEGTGVVVASAASPTGLAMRATVGHFSWWNCDAPIPTGRLDVDIRLPDPPDGDPYRLDDSREVELEARVTNAGDVRQTLKKLDALFNEDPFRADRKFAQGFSYHGPRGLVIPSEVPVGLSACARIRRGELPSGWACGTVQVTVATGAGVAVLIQLIPDEPRNIPVVVRQPATIIVPAGAAAEFQVGATRAFGADTDLSYQWLRDGRPIAGATSATYALPVVGTGDDHARFAVVVTGPAGIAISRTAGLYIVAPPPPPAPPVPPAPPPNAATDRWVDASAGNDANPGSAAAPLRSISAAVAAVASGGTIWLNDGVWTAATDAAIAGDGWGINCIVNTLQAKVTGTVLRAVNPGHATIRYASLVGVCVGNTQVRGIRLEAEKMLNNIGAIWADAPGDSLLSGVSFQGGLILARSGAHITIEPGGLADYGDIGDLSGRAILVVGTGSEVTVNGGTFDRLSSLNSGAGSCATGGNLYVQGGRLFLNNVALRSGPPRNVNATYDIPVAGCNGAQVYLYGTSVAGFVRGTSFEHAAVSMIGSSVVLGGGTTLSGNRSGVYLKTATVALEVDARIEGSTKDGIYINGSGGFSVLTLASGTAVTGSGMSGIEVHGSATTPPSIELQGTTLADNALSGLHVLSGTVCRMRASVLTGNVGQGALFGTSGDCDLGTAASPGGNRFANVGPNVSVQTGTTLAAAGNVWAANQQGSDGLGRFSVAAGQTVLEVAGPVTTGANYRLASTAKIRLAAQ